MRCLWIPAALILGWLSASCASSSPAEGDAAESPVSEFGPTGIPSFLRAKNDGGVPVKAGGNALDALPEGVVHKDEEIVWTNADDANASLPEFDELMKEASQTDGPWPQSESVALRRAKATGKPLVIWFTDRSNAFSQSIASELFNKDDFEAWASENVVRLMVDQGVQGKSMNERAQKQDYVRDLKARYKVSGYPTVLVLGSSGEVVGRYRGYMKGRADFMWGQIKQGVHVANENSRKWRESLEKKGYRLWTGYRGQVLFAKLVAYKEGELLLAEPDGQRVRTKEAHLSSQDREWIRVEKEKRGIH